MMLIPSVLASMSGAFLLASAGITQIQVTTFHNGMARTGQNAMESVLSPGNFNTKTFGLLFTVPVDGQVYAQPLYLPNLTIPGKGKHQTK